MKGATATLFYWQKLGNFSHSNKATVTHDFPRARFVDDFVAGKECGYSVLEERRRRPDTRLIVPTPPEASLFQEEEDEDHGKTDRTDCPPKSVRPWVALNDEATDRWSCRYTAQETELIADESFASLMKEEHIYCVSRTEN